MIDMARDTFKLVIENKLFANPASAYGKMLAGAAGTAVILILLAFTPIPFWISAAIAGFIGGYAMPYLFKDVKFK